MQSYAIVMQSYKLAMNIIKMKPSHESKESKQLWDAVTSTVIHITKNMLKLDAAAHEYFSFIPRFQSSFSHYDSKKHLSMTVSLQYVRRDCREFGDFTKNLEVKVQKLRDEALNCIQKCVENCVGAKAFEEARASRKKTMKEWLDKKAIYDQLALDLDDKFDKLQKQKAVKAAEKARLQYLCESLSTRIASNQEDKNKYVEVKAELQKVVIGIEDSKDEDDGNGNDDVGGDVQEE